MPRILRTPTGHPLGSFVGVQFTVNVTQPSAGAEWSYTLPSGAWYRFVCGQSTLTTSATVASRYCGLTWALGGVTFLYNACSIAQTASQVLTANYIADTTVQTGISGGLLVIGIPGLIMQPASVMASKTFGLQGTDQYSNINLLFEAYYTGPDGLPQGMFNPGDLTDEQLIALGGH